MTTISGTSATTYSSSQVTSEMKTGMDYDAFLQLLVAQIKNQDPLSPMDPTEQMGQLASFSNVEQTIKLNQKFDAMIAVSSLTQADSLIGRTLTTGDGQVSGIVKSVQVASNQVLATLTSGTIVALGDGVSIE